MNQLRILGIGSPFGDDRLGWEVVKLLQQHPKLVHFPSNQLEFICCDRPGMHLLELMRDVNAIFLIDAVKTGAAYGTIHRFENQEIETVTSAFSSHALGVASAIQMGQALNELPSKLVMYGIEINKMLVSSQLEQFSKPIILAIKMLSDQIARDILTTLSI